jgi:hypothetical protein
MSGMARGKWTLSITLVVRSFDESIHPLIDTRIDVLAAKIQFGAGGLHD